MIYIISKLFTALILPPGGIISLLVILTLVIKRYRLLLLGIAFLLYLFSSPFLVHPLLASLEKPYLTSSLHVNADAVVVLGGGVNQSDTHFPLPSEAFKRALHGLVIAKKNNLPLFFSGGGIQKMSEGQGFETTMQTLAKNTELSIPKITTLYEGFGILSEGKSLDTYENAKFTYAFMKNNGLQNPTIALITTAYHMERAKRLYEHFGFVVIPCATDFKLNYDPSQTSWQNYLPSMGAFKAGYIALHEYAGLLSLTLRGV